MSETTATAPATTTAVTDEDHQLLVVWDFDHSLIGENCDAVVFEQLDMGLYERLQGEYDISQGKAGWVKYMDHCCNEAFKEGYTIEDIRTQLPKGISIEDETQELVRTLAADSRVKQVILSNANTLFISIILQAFGLRDCFSEVHTNKHAVEGDRLRVLPYHDEPHGCPTCPPNMCKGTILKNATGWMKSVPTIYIGDGAADYCACAKLTENDYALARKEYPLSDKIAENDIVATVYEWENGVDQSAYIREILDKTLTPVLDA